jgi:hypothetical protein
MLRSLHTYQKMGLKSVTRISEWKVEINQGIPGIRDLDFPVNIENASTGNYVMVQIGCGDMFTVSENMRMSYTWSCG